MSTDRSALPTVSFKEKAECRCPDRACTVFGTLKKNGHVRNCQCRACQAPRYKRRASNDERRIAREKGGEREPLSGALSGADVKGPGWSAEHTREKRICGPVRTAWNNKTLRLVGRRTRFGERVALVLADEKPWLVVQLYEDWDPSGDVA